VNLKASWHLIPDGITTIVQAHFEVEFYVDSALAQEQSDAGMCTLLARATGKTEQEIREAMQAGLWLGELDRPKESTP